MTETRTTGLVAVALATLLSGCRLGGVEYPKCRGVAGLTAISSSASVMFGVGAAAILLPVLAEERSAGELAEASVSALVLGIAAYSLDNRTEECVRTERSARIAAEQRRVNTQEQQRCQAVITAWSSETKPALEKALFDSMTPECKTMAAASAAEEAPVQRSGPVRPPPVETSPSAE